MYNTKNRYEQGAGSQKRNLYVYRQLYQTGWICTVNHGDFGKGGCRESYSLEAYQSVS